MKSRIKNLFKIPKYSATAMNSLALMQQPFVLVKQSSSFRLDSLKSKIYGDSSLSVIDFQKLYEDEITAHSFLASSLRENNLVLEVDDTLIILENEKHEYTQEEFTQDGKYDQNHQQEFQSTGSSIPFRKAIISLLSATASLSFTAEAHAQGLISDQDFEEMLKSRENQPSDVYLDLKKYQLTHKQLQILKSHIEANNHVGHILWNIRWAQNLDSKSLKLKEEIEKIIIKNNQDYQYHPNDYVLALLSKHSYNKLFNNVKNINFQSTDKFRSLFIDFAQIEFPDHFLSEAIFEGLKYLEDSENFQDIATQWSKTLEEWRINHFDVHTSSGYQGVIYINDKSRHVVLAHKGTDPSNPKDLITDFISPLLGIISSQQARAYKLTEDAVSLAKSKGYHLTITGHSLGGWLAELSGYYCYRDFKKDLQNIPMKIVTFDSPGTSTMFTNYRSNIRNYATVLDPKDFNIVTYLTVPNMINNCDAHYGKVYTIFPDKIIYKTEWKLAKHHSITEIIQEFDSNTGKPKNYKKIEDWPALHYFTNPVVKAIILGAMKRTSGKGPELLISGIEDYLQKTVFADLDNTKFYEIYHNHLKISDKKVSEEVEKISLEEGSVGWYLLQFQEESNNIMYLKDNLLARQIKELQELYEIDKNEIKLTSKAINQGLSLENIFYRAQRLVTIIKSDIYLEKDLYSLAIGQKEKLVSDIPMRELKQKFIKRDIEFYEIENALENGKRVIVEGDYGVGKSSLVAEYWFNLYRPKYLIKWFNKNEIPRIYERMAKELNIKIEFKPEEPKIKINDNGIPTEVELKGDKIILEGKELKIDEQEPLSFLFRYFVNKHLKLKKNVFFVFDNADLNDNEVNRYIDDLPQNVRLIITSNNRIFDKEKFKVVKLKTFTKAEAQEFLKMHLSGINSEDLGKIINISQKNPYHLNLVINQFRSNKLLGVREFIKYYCEGANQDISNIVQSTLNEKVSVYGKDFLRYIMFLNPDFISFEILRSDLPSNNALQDVLQGMEFCAPEIVMHEGEKGMRIHNIIQQYIQSIYLKDKKDFLYFLQKKFWCDMNRNNINKDSNKNNELCVSHAEQLLKCIDKSQAIISFSEIFIRNPDLMHLFVCLGVYYEYHQDYQKAKKIFNTIKNSLDGILNLNSNSNLINEPSVLASEICKKLTYHSRTFPTLYAQVLYHLGRVYFREREFDINSNDFCNEKSKEYFTLAVLIRKVIDDNIYWYNDKFNEGSPRPMDSVIFKRNGLLLWHKFQNTEEDLKKALKGYSELIAKEKAFVSDKRDSFNLKTCNRYQVECAIELSKIEDKTKESKILYLNSALVEFSQSLGVNSIGDLNDLEIKTQLVENLLQQLSSESKSDIKIGKESNLLGKIFMHLYRLTGETNDLRHAERFIDYTLTVEENNSRNILNYKKDFVFDDAIKFQKEINEKKIIATSAVGAMTSNINDRYIWRVNIIYDNPLLNARNLKEILSESYKQGGAKAVDQIIDLGKEQDTYTRLIDNIKKEDIKITIAREISLSSNFQTIFSQENKTPPLLIDNINNQFTVQEQSFSEESFVGENNILAYDRTSEIPKNDQFNFQALTVTSFAIKEMIEIAPTLKYFTTKILGVQYLIPQVLQEIELPDFLSSKYIWIGMHYTAGTIGALTLPIAGIDATTKLMVPLISTVIYSFRLVAYDYLAEQKQLSIQSFEDKSISNPIEFIEKCGSDMFVYSTIGVVNSGMNAVLFGMPLVGIAYDITINAVLGGVQCYSVYQQQAISKENHFKTTTESVMPYIIDSIVLYATTRSINFDNSNLATSMLGIKQGLAAISSVVITDQFTKLFLNSNHETINELEDLYLNPMLDYFNENVINVFGDTYSYFMSDKEM